MNKNKITKIFLATVVVIGAVFFALYPWGTHRVSFIISEDSPVKEGIIFSIEQLEGQIFFAPRSIRLKNGNYNYIAWGSSAIPVSGTFTVNNDSVDIPLKMEVGVVDLDQWIDEGKEPIVQPTNTTSVVHVNVEFKIETVTENNQIKEILITPFHRFTTRQDGNSFNEERQLIITSAESWLKENNFDASIPRKIIEN